MPQHFNGQKSGQKGWPIGGISRHHWKIHWKHDGSKFGFTVGFQAHLSTFAMQEWIHNHPVVLPTVCIQPMAVITEDRTQTLGVAFQTFHGRLEILRTKWRFVAGKSDKWRAFHCYVWLPNGRVPPRKPHTLWLSYPSDSRKKKHDAYGPNLMSLTKSLLQWPVNLSILWSKIYTLGLENLSFCREVYMRPSVNLPQNHFCDHSPWEQALLSGLEIMIVLTGAKQVCGCKVFPPRPSGFSMLFRKLACPSRILKPWCHVKKAGRRDFFKRNMWSTVNNEQKVPTNPMKMGNTIDRSNKNNINLNQEFHGGWLHN